MTIQERRDVLLSGKELHLKIERRTFLRAWLSKGLIYFRLDRFQAYSSPLSEESIGYLTRSLPEIQKIEKAYGFSGATVADLDDILNITKTLKVGQQKSW